MKLCSIEACEKVAYAHTWCQKHYDRKKYLKQLPPKPTFEQRYWAKVDKTSNPDGCWLWTGPKNELGYGSISWFGPNIKAHRLSWSWANMCPVPPRRLPIDHMCYNPPCVNPAHLRLVTLKQNAENKSKIPSDNTSGYQGVSWCKIMLKWFAYANSNGKRYKAGYFQDVHEAGAAALEMRNKLFTHNDKDRL